MADQLVVFMIDGERYGVSIDQVQRSSAHTAAFGIQRRSPGARRYQPRSRIIPVLDLASHLGVSSNDGAGGNIVIVDANDATVGIVVDKVDKVLKKRVSEDQVDELPTASASSGRIAKTDDALIVILDLEDLGISGSVTDLAA